MENVVDTPYKTSDLALASWLVLNRMQRVGVIPSGEEGRSFFVFVDAPERSDLVEQWFSGRGEAGLCKRYFAASRDNKRALYEG